MSSKFGFENIIRAWEAGILTRTELLSSLPQFIEPQNVERFLGAISPEIRQLLQDHVLAAPHSDEEWEGFFIFGSVCSLVEEDEASYLAAQRAQLDRYRIGIETLMPYFRNSQQRPR